MSHNLATVNGKAALVYNESGGTPWHKLGDALSEFATYDEWKKAVAGFDCVEVPLTYEHNGQVFTAPGHKGILRPDTGLLLSIMSKQYKVVQPGEIMDFYRDHILLDPRFKLEAAGLLNGGRKFWCVARFEQELNVNGERHICYVMFTTSFDGSLSTTAQAVLIRAICENTWNMAQSGAATIKIPHNVNFQRPDIQARCIENLSRVAMEFERYEAMAEALLGIKVSGDQVENLFKRLTIEKAAKGDEKKAAEPSTKARNQLGALRDAYRTTLAEGTPRNTAWATLNAVTRYVDHGRNARSTSGDSPAQARMASSFYGSGAALKREALAVLAEIGGPDVQSLVGIDA